MIYVLVLVTFSFGWYSGYKTCQYFRDYDNSRLEDKDDEYRKNNTTGSDRFEYGQ